MPPPSCSTSISATRCFGPISTCGFVSVTEQWAQYAIAGPKSRELLEAVVDRGHDISNAAFPYMACGEVTVLGGLRARLFRISFSGELAYELGVPCRHGDAVIRALMRAGESLGVAPYGLEALERHARREGPCGRVASSTARRPRKISASRA